MTRRRTEHGTWHDWQVAIAAIVTLAAIYILSELTDYDPPPPEPPAPASTPPNADAAGSRVTTLSGQTSRAGARTAPPLPGAGATPDPSGRSESSGEAKPRPVVGQTLRCIRWHESRGDYRAENPTSSASGAWQFIDSTWESVTGLPAPASSYPRRVQDAAFRKLWAGGAGAGHWVTASRCGA